MLENNSEQEGDADVSDAPDQASEITLDAGKEFQSFLADVQNMRRSRIENMSSADLMEFGEPIFTLIENSPFFSRQTLSELAVNHQKNVRDIRTMNSAEYRLWGRDVVQAVTAGGSGETTRNIEAGELKEILLSLNETTASNEVCSSLFNKAGGSVYLTPGENVNAANSVCTGGTVFVILPGIHRLAMAEMSKNSNVWAGTGQAVFDGEMIMERAFNGGLTGNVVRGIEIINYTDFGINSKGIENLVVKEVAFRTIGVDKSGQSRGAVMLSEAEDIEITESQFFDVASSVRFVSSRGPLQVTENRALNSGRNFFQCDKCSGGGIRINRNSMEHERGIGTEPLEDWINIYQSKGTPADPIQVNFNRARGHSNSKSGSFIMLGDSGGSHQLAKGNIGVNPGQVGIGIAGGSHIDVENNKMFSESWEGSNVAYYSALYSEECGNHDFSGSGNVAHWRNSSGELNRSWTDGKCGISIGQIRSVVQEDRNLGADIWDEWRP
ncbi:MAG: hypothetical protein R6V27_16475 [Balneolaceae bacterium]